MQDQNNSCLRQCAIEAGPYHLPLYVPGIPFPFYLPVKPLINVGEQAQIVSEKYSLSLLSPSYVPIL